MKKLFRAITLYRTVARWNGESVSDLYETIKSVVLTLPFILVQPLAYILQNLKFSRAMRFDLTAVSEPVIAVDKKGFALVGTLRGFRVLQLRTIDTRDRTYEIAPPTVSVRCRPIK